MQEPSTNIYSSSSSYNLVSRVYQPTRSSRIPLIEKFAMLAEVISSNEQESSYSQSKLKNRVYKPMVENKPSILEKTAALLSSITDEPPSRPIKVTERAYKPMVRDRVPIADKFEQMATVITKDSPQIYTSMKEREYKPMKRERLNLLEKTASILERVFDEGPSSAYAQLKSRDYKPMRKKRRSVIDKLVEGVPKALQSPGKEQGPLLITATGSRPLRVGPSVVDEKKAKIIVRVEKDKEVRYLNQKHIELEENRRKNQERLSQENEHYEERYSKDIAFSRDVSRDNEAINMHYQDEIQESRARSAYKNYADVSHDSPSRIYSSNKHSIKIKHSRHNSHQQKELLDRDYYAAEYIRREDMRQLRNRTIDRERQAFIESAKFVERMNLERKEREMRLQRQKERLMKKMDDMHNRIKAQQEIRKARHEEEIFIMKHQAIQDKIKQQKIAIKNRQADNHYSDMVTSVDPGGPSADNGQAEQRVSLERSRHRLV